VKCDETHPRCKNCTRVERDCEYPSPKTAKAYQRPRTLSARTDSLSARTDSLPSIDNTLNLPEPLPGGLTSTNSTDATQPWAPFPADVLPEDSFFLDDSLFSFENGLTPSFGPVEWYDLLAEDAISNMQGQQPSNRWNFDLASLSRRQTPRQSVAPETLPDDVEGQQLDGEAQLQLWTTEARIELKEEELVLFEHYINVVAPILDLFDPLRHFATTVPHLALRNVGLLKSILAVGARHMTLVQHQVPDDSESPLSTRSISNASKFAEQYYFETLQYLSQNLLYQTYTTSRELHVTALLISTYEMFGTAGVSNHSAWDRHLRGTFWIQRACDISGESPDSLKRAVWFAWLRQDIWAAFRTGRPALTIHQPTKAIRDLTPDELTTRIIYLTAKCVQYAAAPKHGDIPGYIDAGTTLTRMLDAWNRCLPPSYEPIAVQHTPTPTPTQTSSPPSSSTIAPIWIHPPAHAAAVQMYHFSRIILVLNQPSTGGLGAYQTRVRTLRESTAVICGIAVAAQARNLPSAFVSFQAVYAAALCADTQDRQAEIVAVLRGVLDVGGFPSRAILADLVAVWEVGT
jgi:hypothetical protein